MDIRNGTFQQESKDLLWLVIEDYSYQNIQHTDISIELWNISDIPTSPASEILSDHSRSLRIDN